MFADTETCFWSYERSRWRLWAATLALAGCLVAAGLAGVSPASAATVVRHSADHGELRDGRLILRGVSGRVAYAIEGGRSGKVSVRRLHRRVFLPRRPATGTLDIAGRGGANPRFKLTKPRYKAAHDTVSYRAKPLARKPNQTARAAGAARSFGPASLSIVPHQRLAGGNNGGNDCKITLYNHAMTGQLSDRHTWWDVQQVNASKWSNLSWDPAPPPTITSETQVTWSSVGGLWTGCQNSATWQFVPKDYAPDGRATPEGTITATIKWDWGGTPSSTCTSTNPDFPCLYQGQSGDQFWMLWGPGQY
jgi:hypothetical protein